METQRRKTCAEWKRKNTVNINRDSDNLFYRTHNLRQYDEYWENPVLTDTSPGNVITKPN